MNIGDVVQLKSGGPAMTVSNKMADNMLLCWWFNANNDLCTQAFAPTVLQPWKKS